MYRILNIVVLMVLSLNVWAGPVSVEQALQKARLFVNSKHSVNSGKRLQRVQIQPQLQTTARQSDGAVPYYVFNIGDANGCVFVSGDDRTPAILGFTDSGSYDAEQMPPAMKAWLAEYERQMACLDHVRAASSQHTERESINKLIFSNWNQGAPYNYMCPIDPETGEQSVTGCVATAMAQVMKFHRYPENTIATIPAYITQQRKINMPEIGITHLDWEYMFDTYSSNTQPESYEAKAVSTLMKLCGQSVEMDYTSNGSGASSDMVGWALYKYFGYDEGIQRLYRDYFSLDEWNDLIYAELAAKRPVLFSGYSVEGGHAFVIDGYYDDDLFHVNWGWGGVCDGYFLLSILNPDNNSGIGASVSGDGYSVGQEILIGIQKSTGKTGTVPAVASNWLSTPHEEDVTTYERTAQGTFNPTFYFVFSNTAVSTQHFDLGLGIFDENGVLVETQELYSNYTMGGYDFLENKKDVDIAQSLPDGKYIIKGISRQAGSSEWKVNIGSGSEYIQVVIQGNQLTMTTYYVDLNASFTLLTDNPQPKKPIKLRATINNNGFTVRDQLYLTGASDNEMISGVDFDVDAGKTTTIDFEVSVPSYGSYQYRLLKLNYSTYTFDCLAEITIDVAERSDLTIDGIHYDYLSKDDQTVVVSSRGASDEDYSGVLAIPGTIVVNGTTYTVKGISAGAFQNRKEITELVIGDEVETIGKNAFKGCSGLTKVSFGKELKSVDADAFSGCSSIKGVYTNNFDGYCAIVFGNQNSNPLYSTKSYSRKLYVNGSEIQGKIVLPEGLSTTGMLSFYDCDGITQVVLPSTLSSIGKHTFSGCKQMTSVEIKEGVMMIDNSAFARCSSLTTVILPSSLSKLVSYAFAKCSGLQHVYVLAGTPPVVASNTFDASTCVKATLHVVKGLVEAYQNASVWNQFANIVEIDDDELLNINAHQDALTTQVDYFDLSGKQIGKHQKGVVVVREQKADGTVLVRKVVR